MAIDLVASVGITKINMLRLAMAAVRAGVRNTSIIFVYVFSNDLDDTVAIL